jgi:hypothetical protein
MFFVVVPLTIIPDTSGLFPASTSVCLGCGVSRAAPFAHLRAIPIWHKDGFILGQNDPDKAPVWAEMQGHIGAVMSNPGQTESK